MLFFYLKAKNIKNPLGRGFLKKKKQESQAKPTRLHE
jgi:hypothetical protein